MLFLAAAALAFASFTAASADVSLLDDHALIARGLTIGIDTCSATGNRPQVVGIVSIPFLNVKVCACIGLPLSKRELEDDVHTYDKRTACTTCTGPCPSCGPLGRSACGGGLSPSCACTCSANAHQDTTTGQCVCNSGFENVNGQCVPVCKPNSIRGAYKTCKCTSPFLPSGMSSLATPPTCTLAASPASRRLARRLRHSQLARRDCIGEDETACPYSADRLDAGFDCVDTTASLEHCGGCSTTGAGVNCLEMSNAVGITCFFGQCQALSCEPGFHLSVNNTCVT